MNIADADARHTADKQYGRALKRREVLLTDITSGAGDVYHLLETGGKFYLARDCAIIVTVDPAASEKKTADPTGIGVFAATPDGHLLILDMIRERLSIEGIVPRLAKVCRQWNPQWVGMEADGFQVGVARW
jgi:hypothetical protein